MMINSALKNINNKNKVKYGSSSKIHTVCRWSYWSIWYTAHKLIRGTLWKHQISFGNKHHAGYPYWYGTGNELGTKGFYISWW